MKNYLFEFKETEKGKGIFIKLKDEDRLVYPTRLFQTLWDCNRRRLLSNNVEASFQILSDKVCANYFDYKHGYYRIDYDRGEFVRSATDSLMEYARSILQGEPSLYSDSMNRHPERILEGLDNLKLPKNYFQVFTGEVTIEKAHFEFTDDFSYDMGFLFRIGNREYRSWMSRYTNDLNTIRHELEGLVMKNSQTCTIHIYNEDIANTIRIEKIRVHDGNGKWEHVAKVTLEPDTFVGGPVLFGYCDCRQLLKTLYLGFLNLFVRETSWTMAELCGSCSWDRFRIVSYNRLQSCLIEYYLLGIDETESTVHCRQHVIRSVHAMKNDYKGMYNKLNEVKQEIVPGQRANN